MTKAEFEILRKEYATPKKACSECTLLLLYDLHDIRITYQCTILQVFGRTIVSVANNI